MAKVATVMTDLFEDVEFTPPRDALVKAGHEVVVIGPEAGTTVTGKKEEATVEVDVGIDEANLDDYDALLIPGGNYASLGPEQQELFVSVFQSGWFIVSLWTQTLVLYTLRTPKIPFIESYPSCIMTTITSLGIIVGSVAPYTELGTSLGLASLPGSFWLILAVTVIAYLVLVQVVKKVYIDRHGELL